MPKTHFPPDIQLKTSPLVEAWLTITWKLEPVLEGESIFRDPRFPFALGTFYESIREDFGRRRELPASSVPIEMTAYKPHYQFLNNDAGDWRLIQFGPGLATLNYLRGYSWREFRENANYLRSKLYLAYEDNLELNTISLRYRNAFPFEFSSGNIFKFLAEQLNTTVEMPKHIPGQSVANPFPSEIQYTNLWILSDPPGRGILRFATGFKHEVDKTTGNTINAEHVINEIEIISENTEGPALSDETAFREWLDAAHSVAHDWFFSLIEGDLFIGYKGE